MHCCVETRYIFETVSTLHDTILAIYAHLFIFAFARPKNAILWIVKESSKL